jgi:hypothetical protein
MLFIFNNLNLINIDIYTNFELLRKADLFFEGTLGFSSALSRGRVSHRANFPDLPHGLASMFQCFLTKLSSKYHIYIVSGKAVDGEEDIFPVFPFAARSLVQRSKKR